MRERLQNRRAALTLDFECKGSHYKATISHFDDGRLADIEDALSAHEATGLGAWAAGAAGFMPVLAAAVPSYIEAVTVYAHEDKAGQAGAHELAEALDHRGIEIRLEGLGQ
jgi:hypothetical protein